MKKIILVVFALTLFGVFGSQRVNAAEPIFQIHEPKESYFQNENIDLWLTLSTPHPILKADYYIVNSKTSKKTLLGHFDLDSMSAGFVAGLIINQKPGTYYYTVIVDDGSNKTQYRSSSIKIIDKKKAKKPKIKDFNIELTKVSASNNTYGFDQSLWLTSTLDNKFSDIYGKVSYRCSKDVIFHSKDGELTCSKKKKTYQVTNELNERFFLDSTDLVKPIKFEAEFKLINSNQKVIATKKVKKILQGVQ